MVIGLLSLLFAWVGRVIARARSLRRPCEKFVPIRVDPIPVLRGSLYAFAVQSGFDDNVFHLRWNGGKNDLVRDSTGRELVRIVIGFGSANSLISCPREIVDILINRACAGCPHTMTLFFLTLKTGTAEDVRVTDDFLVWPPVVCDTVAA
jgi:hypothetical protein